MINMFDFDRLWGRQSTVSLHLYQRGGLELLQVSSQTNPMEFANKISQEIGSPS
jgi:hypothetical protein